MQTYRIFDNRGKCYLPAVYQTRKSAQRVADRKDLDYGAYRYFVESVWIAQLA